MTRPDAVDYSFGRPTSPAALKAQGIKLVMRYLSPPPNAKNLTKAEAQGLLGAGLGILLGWETNANRALTGRAGGRADGHAAANLAESLGAPRGLTIYYAVDFDTDRNQPNQWAVIAEYFRGVDEETRYKVGVYGEADILEYLHGLGVVTSEWQTYAWSGGRLSSEADLYQYLNGQHMAGATVDLDRIIHADKLGAWWPGGVIPQSLPPSPITPPHAQSPEGLFMPDLTDPEQHRMLASTDKMSYALDHSILPTLTTLSTRIDAISAKVGQPISGGDDVDEEALAAAISTNLTATLPTAVVAAIKAAL